MHDAIARDVTTRQFNSKLPFLISARYQYYTRKGKVQKNQMN